MLCCVHPHDGTSVFCICLEMSANAVWVWVCKLTDCTCTRGVRAMLVLGVSAACVLLISSLKIKKMSLHTQLSGGHPHDFNTWTHHYWWIWRLSGPTVHRNNNTHFIQRSYAELWPKSCVSESSVKRHKMTIKRQKMTKNRHKRHKLVWMYLLPHFTAWNCER